MRMYNMAPTTFNFVSQRLSVERSFRPWWHLRLASTDVKAVVSPPLQIWFLSFFFLSFFLSFLPSNLRISGISLASSECEYHAILIKYRINESYISQIKTVSYLNVISSSLWNFLFLDLQKKLDKIIQKLEFNFDLPL